MCVGEEQEDTAFLHTSCTGLLELPSSTLQALLGVDKATGTGPSGLLALSWVQTVRAWEIWVQGSAKKFLPSLPWKVFPATCSVPLVALAPTGEAAFVQVPHS